MREVGEEVKTTPAVRRDMDMDRLGGVVDQEALVGALGKGEIAGGALDVGRASGESSAARNPQTGCCDVR
jgi:hypothetical protein